MSLKVTVSAFHINSSEDEKMNKMFEGLQAHVVFTDVFQYFFQLYFWSKNELATCYLDIDQDSATDVIIYEKV